MITQKTFSANRKTSMDSERQIGYFSFKPNFNG